MANVVATDQCINNFGSCQICINSIIRPALICWAIGQCSPRLVIEEFKHFVQRGFVPTILDKLIERESF